MGERPHQLHMTLPVVTSAAPVVVTYNEGLRVTITETEGQDYSYNREGYTPVPCELFT